MRHQKFFLEILILGIFFAFQPEQVRAADVKGRVLFTGNPPAPVTVQVRNPSPVCGKTKVLQKLRVGKDRGLAEVVVILDPAKSSRRRTPPQRGVINQSECEFNPHVQVLPLESMLQITNSDSSLFHNVHGYYEDNTTAFQMAVLGSGFISEVKLQQSGVLTLRSDSGYEWMNAYVYVTYEEFAAVTDEEGRFTFKDVPEGKYDVELWHPWLGRYQQKFTVEDSEKVLEIPWQL